MQHHGLAPRHWLPRLLFLSLLSLHSACEGAAGAGKDKEAIITERLITKTAGFIGCPAKRIELLSYAYREYGDSWWMASCDGVERPFVCSLFYASTYHHGVAYHLQCTPFREKQN